MKKVIILSLMIVSAFSVDAQRKRTRTATSQGNVVVRFGLGINSVKNDHDFNASYQGALESTYNTVTFMPKVGYMVIDNLELGVRLGVTNWNDEIIYDQSPVLDKTVIKGTTVDFGVYVQKYFPLNNWFAFTTGADLGLSTGTRQEDHVTGSVTDVIESATGNTSGVGVRAEFGLAFTPYNAFALQANIASLGVNTTKWDPDGVNNTENETHYGFNVMPYTASLDFVWYFGRGLWKK